MTPRQQGKPACPRGTRGGAAAAKADDGSFFWCVCTFHQQKRLDGSFGPLELTHTGDKKPNLEENIDK